MSDTTTDLIPCPQCGCHGHAAGDAPLCAHCGGCRCPVFRQGSRIVDQRGGCVDLSLRNECETVALVDGNGDPIPDLASLSFPVTLTNLGASMTAGSWPELVGTIRLLWPHLLVGFDPTSAPLSISVIRMCGSTDDPIDPITVA